jgi:hypothetical protein
MDKIPPPPKTVILKDISLQSIYHTVVASLSCETSGIFCLDPTVLSVNEWAGYGFDRTANFVLVSPLEQKVDRFCPPPPKHRIVCVKCQLLLSAFNPKLNYVHRLLIINFHENPSTGSRVVS